MTRAPRILALTAVALAAVALAACGGGSSSSSSSTPSPASTAPRQANGNKGTGSPADFVQVLMNNSGFTLQQATCIEQTVLAKIGRPTFDRIYGTGHIPQRIQSIVFKASLKCAPRGAGQ